jgi:hypothetical protein
MVRRHTPLVLFGSDFGNVFRIPELVSDRYSLLTHLNDADRDNTMKRTTAPTSIRIPIGLVVEDISVKKKPPRRSSNTSGAISTLAHSGTSFRRMAPQAGHVVKPGLIASPQNPHLIRSGIPVEGIAGGEAA